MRLLNMTDPHTCGQSFIPERKISLKLKQTSNASLLTQRLPYPWGQNRIY